MESNKLIKTSRITSIISFIGGTIIILLFYITNASEYAFLGMAYAFIVGIINLIILLLLTKRAYVDNVNRKRLFRSCIFLLLNIPVFFLYCWFAIILLNTVRITFIN